MSKHQRLIALSLLTAAGLAVACTLDGGSHEETSTTIRRDSAGVHIVENPAISGSRGGEWQVESPPVVVIGAARYQDAFYESTAFKSEEIPLQQVQAVNVLSDGRIIVADNGTSEVMLFDSVGLLVTRFVGRGEGPGELRSVWDVHVCSSDSIVVVSGREMLIFDDRGMFVRQVRFNSGPQPMTPLGVSSNCREVLTQWRASEPPLDSWGLIEDVFAWVDPLSQTVDTLLTFSSQEGWTRKLYGGPRPYTIPWGTSYTRAVTGDDFLIGYGRVPEIHRYDATGALKSVIRWVSDPEPVTRSDRRRYSRLRLERLATLPDHPESRFWFPALDEFPEVPSHKPLYDRILVDDQQGLWVRKFPVGSYGLFDLRLPDQTWLNQTWSVFDSTGVRLGDLTLPDRFDLRVVARERLYGVMKDSLDVETVQVFLLGRSSGPGD